MTIPELVSICESNGLTLDEAMQSALGKYAELLSNWNSKINLISRKDEAHILDRHILHSLVLRMPTVSDYGFAGKRALDLGTGGGLPGIPLKIVAPSLNITLADSIQKKITACTAMLSELGLSGTQAICSRAEELARIPAHANTYDVVLSRAVAPLQDLAKWSRGLLKPGGVLLSLKGGELSEEIRRAELIKDIQAITIHSLDLNGYDDFLREEKKLVLVNFLGDTHRN